MKLTAKSVLSRGSARQPRYFSLLVQRKVSKRKDTPMPPFSWASHFWRGFSEGASHPLGKRVTSLPHPCGPFTRYIPVPRPWGATHDNRQSCRLVSPKTAMLGAA